jgi:hypothetical protein
VNRGTTHADSVTVHPWKAGNPHTTVREKAGFVYSGPMMVPLWQTTIIKSNLYFHANIQILRTHNSFFYIKFAYSQVVLKILSSFYEHSFNSPMFLSGSTAD